MADQHEIPQVRLNEITERLEIDYPTRWLYKVIGANKAAVTQAILEIIDADDATLEVSNTSSRGRYVSINVTVEVHSDRQRTDIYESLRGHPHVKIVL